MMKKLFPLFLMPLSLFAQSDQPPSKNDPFQTVIMIGVGVIFLYFILIRPEQKRRKALEEQVKSLKQGDKVTAMGIIGTIVRVLDETVILKMYDGSKIEVVKGSVTQILGHEEAQKEKS
ncbi:MAG: preprotein translocase subunit YajC [Waddliaceae bacterium]